MILADWPKEPPPRNPVSTEYDRGWNAAMSYAETYLVGMACDAFVTKGVGDLNSYTQRVLLLAAEKVGRVRKPIRKP